MSSERNNDLSKPTAAKDGGETDWLDLVRKHVESLKFGSVNISVSDFEVTEISVAERTRMERPKPSNSGTNRGTGSR